MIVPEYADIMDGGPIPAEIAPDPRRHDPRADQKTTNVRCKKCCMRMKLRYSITLKSPENGMEYAVKRIGPLDLGIKNISNKLDNISLRHILNETGFERHAC
jgi:hypothetical protein